MDGERLLTLFGLLMILVGMTMLRLSRDGDEPSPWLLRETAGSCCLVWRY